MRKQSAERSERRNANRHGKYLVELARLFAVEIIETANLTGRKYDEIWNYHNNIWKAYCAKENNKIQAIKPLVDGFEKYSELKFKGFRERKLREQRIKRKGLLGIVQRLSDRTVLWILARIADAKRVIFLSNN